MSTLYKILAIIFLIFIGCALYDENMYFLSYIIGICVIMSIKSIFCDFFYTDYFENDYGYEHNYYDKDYNTYTTTQNTYGTTSQTYKPTTYYSKSQMTKNIELDILQQIIPSLSIETSNDNPSLNSKKIAYSKKIMSLDVNGLTKMYDAKKENNNVKPTQQIPLLPAPQPQTNSNFEASLKINNVLLLPQNIDNAVVSETTNAPKSVIFINNIRDLNSYKEQIYSTIIAFLKKKCLSVFVIREILTNFIYVDVIEEDNNSTILYVKDFKIFKKYDINCREIVDEFNKNSQLNGKFSFAKYENCSVLDYYDEKYK